MSHGPRARIPSRAVLAPPEIMDGLYTLTQPHTPSPVGWLWVSQGGALEHWVVTSNWRDPSSSNTPQAVTFVYVAPYSTVANVGAFLAWIKSSFPLECPLITDRYEHVVTQYSASCPP